MCLVKFAKGNLKNAILYGVNMGRDTDCLTAVAAGITGSLSGTADVPEEWIRQVDYATSVNPYTSVKKTIKENADGLYEAFQARLRKMKAYINEMESI